MCEKMQCAPQKNVRYQEKTNPTHEKIWSLSKKEIEPTKKSGACQKTSRTREKNLELVKKTSRSREKKIELIVKNKSNPSKMMELVKKNKSSPPKHIKL